MLLCVCGGWFVCLFVFGGGGGGGAGGVWSVTLVIIVTTPCVCGRVLFERERLSDFICVL